MFNCMELREPSEHDDWTGFSVVSGPAAEPCENPGGVGKGAFRMRVLLFLGVSFKALADLFEHGLVFRDQRHLLAAGRQRHRAPPRVAS